MSSATKTDFNFYLNTWRSQKTPGQLYTNCLAPEPTLIQDLNSLIPNTKPLETLFSKCVIIKLNGGLATSMSHSGPKALIKLNAKQTILDKCIQHHEKLEQAAGIHIPLTFMLSPFTKEATLNAMEKHHSKFTFDHVTQSEVSRYCVDSSSSAPHKAPPGHGELILLLKQTNKLQKLVDQGIEYAFISNIDNLCAQPDPNILNHCLTQKPPILMEVVKKSPEDKKGGIIAKLNSGNHSVIESAELSQLPDETQAHIQTFPYFNTNNLWIHLPSILELLNKAPFPLPILANKKVINQQDTIQFETVIGKLIEQFDSPQFLLVDSNRFCPIKSDDDLVKVQTQQAFHFVIQSNSPGELSHWVMPIAQRIGALHPNTEIELFLTPCQYASGKEALYAKSLPNISKVHLPDETLKYTLSPPYRAQTQTGGAVLFLGGDPSYAKQLARKFGYPAYAYAEHPLKGFKKCFTSKVDGDLMESAISASKFNRDELCKKYHLDPKKKYCLFMPGSRPKHFVPLYPFMTAIIERIQAKQPDFEPLILISPFIDEDTEKNTIDPSKPFKTLRGDSKELINLAHMMVSIPGTNTIEAAYIGTPMICILPTNKPEAIIFDGLLGILSNIPIIGKPLKKALITVALKQTTYFSKPNQKLNKNVVPEYAGILDPIDLAEPIASYFYDEQALNSQRNALKPLRNNDCVADKIVNEMITS